MQHTARSCNTCVCGYKDKERAPTCTSWHTHTNTYTNTQTRTQKYTQTQTNTLTIWHFVTSPPLHHAHTHTYTHTCFFASECLPLEILRCSRSCRTCVFQRGREGAREVDPHGHTHTCIHTHTHIYIYIFILCILSQFAHLEIHICIYMHACKHSNLHIFVNVYLPMYVYT